MTTPRAHQTTRPTTDPAYPYKLTACLSRKQQAEQISRLRHLPEFQHLPTKTLRSLCAATITFFPLRADALAAAQQMADPTRGFRAVSVQNTRTGAILFEFRPK